jgi:FkbM family methyltransferase
VTKTYGAGIHCGRWAVIFFTTDIRGDKGVNSATEESTAFENALRILGPQSLTIADVGARWGATDAWFRLKPLAFLIGFEPDAAECERLNATADPTQEKFYPVALGRSDGEGRLYVTKEPACSSLYPPSDSMLETYPSLRPIMSLDRVIAVPQLRLATWANEADIDRLDFIKLDTQGSELDILLGAGTLLDTCLGIEVEVEFSPLYDGQPLFSDVDNYLRSRGFTIWRLNHQAHYAEHPSNLLAHKAVVHYEHVPVTHPAGDGRLVWANALYFRDYRTLTDTRTLLALATLLEAAGDDDGSRCCRARLNHDHKKPADTDGPASNRTGGEQ